MVFKLVLPSSCSPAVLFGWWAPYVDAFAFELLILRHFSISNQVKIFKHLLPINCRRSVFNSLEVKRVEFLLTVKPDLPHLIFSINFFWFFSKKVFFIRNRLAKFSCSSICRSHERIYEQIRFTLSSWSREEILTVSSFVRMIWRNRSSSCS